MELFDQKVEDYKESNRINSPIWIWFEKNETKDEAKCLICKTYIQCKNSSTTAMTNHLTLIPTGSEIA